MTGDAIVFRSIVLDGLRSLGVDVDAALARAGMAASDFAGPKATLTTEAFFRLWRAVESVAPAPDLGLRLGGTAIAGRIDVATIVALDAANAGEALARVARYKRLCMPEEVRIEISGDDVAVVFHWLHAAERLPKILIDSTFAHIVAMLETGTGRRVKPARIELSRRPAHASMLERYFGCAVAFDLPLDRLVFHHDILAVPFRAKETGVYAELSPGLECELQRTRDGSSVADDVRAIVRRSMFGDRPTIEKVADALRLRPRTLQRRLRAHTTSYQHLLDEERRRIAQRLLSDTDLDPGEIAFVLGFEEVNSFSRAFVSWTGITPMRWRGERSPLSARR